MPSRLKKTQKSGGRGSHGHGPVDKHQKHPGGLGDAGGTHHHRINQDRYHPAYFGETRAVSIIAVVQSGYYTVWGKGKLPKQPVIMKTKFFIAYSQVERGSLNANKCFSKKKKNHLNSGASKKAFLLWKMDLAFQ
uniref:Large ribosomal subunit protein uL15 n=1 Tax=Ursus maritimus TaxID=29073 RepID=A0A452UGS8_URSMA